jgi:metal-responsive CopG/Arc/MetJ family transcriptional regulator
MKQRKSPKKSITLPPEILREVEAYAAADGRSLSNAISHLLQKGIEVQHQAEAVLREASGPAYKTKVKK